jgi:hypothetical protein
VTSTPIEITLSAGTLALFTDVEITNELLVTDVYAETTEINSVSIYPNPVGDYLNLSSDQEIVGAEFYSMQGAEVFPEKITGVRWNVSHLPRGMYVVDVKTTARKRYQLKFIKI